MNTDEPSTEAASRKPVRERLQALKEAGAALLTTTLPQSEIDVTYPGFLSHDKVMGAAKIAGKDRNAMAKIVIAQVCLFDGERLSAAEIGSLVDNRDVTHMSDLLFGKDDDEDEDGEGN